MTDKKVIRVSQADFNGLHPLPTTRAADRRGVSATLKYEQLPDMRTARIGHQAFPADGGLIVVGGRTTGFKLTATAEQYKDGLWSEISSSYAHDGAFAVELGTNRFMIGGGFSKDKGVGQAATTSVYNSYSPTRLLRNKTLSVPRAMSKAINVGGKVYVSGNWYADDKTFDYWDSEAESFTSVGVTDSRSAPYLFSDNNGRVMSLSAYNNFGESFGFYTDSDGSQMLVADIYDPSKGTTSRIGFPFSPQNVPMRLPEDAKSSDYHLVVGGENCYLILSRQNDKYSLSMFDMDSMEFYLFNDFDIPTKYQATGEDISWRGSVLVNQNRQEIYLIGASGPVSNQTLHVISLNYVSDEWTIASATGFKHNLMSASWTLLPDGRIACTGGGIKDNTDAQRNAYLVTPSVAGRGDESELEDGEMVDRKFLVVETKNHVKTAYMLAEKPEVSFVGNTMRITSAKTDVTYNLTDVLRFTYETRSVTGVSELRTDPATIGYEDDQLIVSGIKSGASVGIYALDGKLVQQLTPRRTGTYRVSLKSLPQGMYIVKADNVTYKIMKR